MRITVEFFGIPRLRAGTAQLDVELANANEIATLADVVHALRNRLPELARDCLTEDGLQPGYIANLNGGHFVTAPETELTDGQTLLILSADVGG